MNLSFLGCLNKYIIWRLFFCAQFIWFALAVFSSSMLLKWKEFTLALFSLPIPELMVLSCSRLQPPSSGAIDVKVQGPLDTLAPFALLVSQ